MAKIIPFKKPEKKQEPHPEISIERFAAVVELVAPLAYIIAKAIQNAIEKQKTND